MTIDFKLVTDSERKEEIYNQNGYQIEMISATNNELPVITDDNALLFNQTIALFATINKGQLIDSPYFGLNPSNKRKMQNSDITAQMYQIAIMEELSDMITTLFLNNYEILDYASNTLSYIQIDSIK